MNVSRNDNGLRSLYRARDDDVVKLPAIERTIGKLKQLRRVVTRHDHIHQNYLSSQCLTALGFWR